MERFTGLNIHSFSLIRSFVGVLLRFLGHKCLLFSIIKERYFYMGREVVGHVPCKVL